MSKQATVKAARGPLKSVEGGAGGGGGAEVTKVRKMRGEGKARVGGDFTAQLRALAVTHRAKLGGLVALESKLEAQRAAAVEKIDRKLATVRAQREAAEAPLRDVEAMLAARPPLPGIDVEAPPPAVEGGEALPAELDTVNQ